MKTALILGGGFAGFTWAYFLSKRGWKVTILEKENVSGGDVRTHYYNGHPYTRGPRHFIGTNDKALEFMESMVPQRALNHSALTYVGVDDAFYQYPLHKDDIARMPDKGKILSELANVSRRQKEPPKNLEEKWENGVGKTLYHKFIEQYTKQHFGIPSNTVLTYPSFGKLLHGNGYATLREGAGSAVEGGYVTYPIDVRGWDVYFERIIAETEITVYHNITITKYDVGNRTVYADEKKFSGDLLVSSIPIDVVCECAYGELPYAGREITPLVLPVEEIFPKDVYFLYYAGDEPYLRIVEYKKLTGYESPNTLLGIESPAKGPRDYPYPILAEQMRAQRYLDSLPDNVISVGRMGKYKWENMPDIIMDCMERVREL